MDPASSASRLTASGTWPPCAALARILLLALAAFPLPAADEALPFAELTYRRDDGLVLPQPIASWWRESLSEALPWWMAAAGVPIAADQFGSTLHCLRLVAGGIPAPDGLLTPTIAGWLSETSPQLAPSVLAASARWPGFTATVRPGSVALCSAHGIMPADGQPPPGLLVVVHGPGFYEELTRRMPAHERGAVPDEQDLEQFLLRLTRRWEPAAAVAGSADGVTGTIMSGLPARWFRPLDAAVLARLPADTSAWFALALDGRALGEDLQAALAEQGLTTVWPLALVPFLTPQTVAQACDGTWVVAGGPSGLLIRAPRSPALDALLGGMALLFRLKLPSDQTPVALGDSSLLAACSASDWIVAATAEGIAAWFNESPHLAVQLAPAALLAGWADRLRTSAAAEALAEVLPGQEPLPTRSWWGAHHGEESDWQRMARQLDGPGAHLLSGSGSGGTLTLALGGPVLPWLLPGMAIRWFADIAEDEDGTRRLRAEVLALHQAKQAVFPDEGLAAIPPIESAQLAAWKGLVESVLPIADDATHRNTFVGETKRLSDEVVPWATTDHDKQALAHANELMALTRPLDDPAFPRGGDPLLLAEAVQSGSSRLDYYTLVRAAQVMATAGLHLAAHGDARGGILTDRALALVEHCPRLVGPWMIGRIAFARDRTWFIAGTLPGCDRGAHARWLAEAPPSAYYPDSWRGERIFAVGRVAERWLGGGSPTRFHPADEFAGLERTRFGLCQSHFQRARTATALAAFMGTMFQIESGDLAAFTSEAFTTQSPLLFGYGYAPEMFLNTGYLNQCRHCLIRFAARIQGLRATGDLPATQALAEAAVGHLALPYGDTLLPVTYQRLAGNAFRLFVADQVPPPPGSWPKEWKGSVAASEVPAGRHLVMPNRVLEVVVDPRPPPRPTTGTNDF